MNRRQLFGRLATIAAAVALAPVAKTEAAPMGKDSPWGRVYTSAELRQARAEAYERGRAGDGLMNGQGAGVSLESESICITDPSIVNMLWQRVQDYRRRRGWDVFPDGAPPDGFIVVALPHRSEIAPFWS